MKRDIKTRRLGEDMEAAGDFGPRRREHGRSTTSEAGLLDPRSPVLGSGCVFGLVTVPKKKCLYIVTKSIKMKVFCYLRCVDWRTPTSSSSLRALMCRYWSSRSADGKRWRDNFSEETTLAEGYHASNSIIQTWFSSFKGKTRGTGRWHGPLWHCAVCTVWAKNYWLGELTYNTTYC